MVMVHSTENTTTVELTFPEGHYAELAEIMREDDWTREIRGERANDDDVVQFIDEQVIPQYIISKRRNPDTQ